MKRTSDHRTVALFLWVFGIVALGQLALHWLTISRIEDQVAREVKASHDAPFKDKLDKLKASVQKDVEGDFLTAFLVTSCGLFLTVLGQRLLNHRLAKRLERERLSTESATFARSTVDALPTHIAILDQSGVVLAVNRAWKEFEGEQG